MPITLSSSTRATNVVTGLTQADRVAVRQGIDPLPQPAAVWGTTHSFWHRWAELELGPNASTGGPQLPNLAEAGKPFRVRYLKNPGDIGQSGQARTITLKWSIDGGPTQSATVADGARDLRTGELMRQDVHIAVPDDARGDLAYWFEIETTDGRTLFDSDYGNNFHAAIAPQGGAVLRFDDWWGEQQHGTLVAGESLRIAYDTDRLKQFLYATRHHGYETWGVSAFVQFEGADGKRTPIEVPLTVVKRGPFGSADDTAVFEPALPIPLDATRVHLWFRGTSYGGSRQGGPAWDSDLGNDYAFAVAPAVD